MAGDGEERRPLSGAPERRVASPHARNDGDDFSDHDVVCHYCRLAGAVGHGNSLTLVQASLVQAAGDH